MYPNVESRAAATRASVVLALSSALALCAPAGCSLFVPMDDLSSGGGVDASGNRAEPSGDGGASAQEGTLRADATPAPAAALDAETLGAWTGDAGVVDAEDAAEAGALPADSGPDAGCPEGRIRCGDACVDPTTDPMNCNGCGNVCHDGLCGTSVDEDMHGTPSSAWVFNGTARYSGSTESAAMTAANVLYQAGTVTYRNPIAVDSFTAKFEFRMGYGGGSRNDGMGFLFQKTGPTAVSGAGESLGMVGLDGYAVELDLVNNEGCGDMSDDHLGVDSLTNCPAASPLPTSLYATDLTGVVDLADANWHQALVSFKANALSVQIDGKTYVTDVTLPGFVAGMPYYFGFAGATGGIAGGPDGGGGYRSEVKDVTFAFPTPRCL